MCACDHCAAEARARGVDVADVRCDVESVSQAIRRMGPSEVITLAEGGVTSLLGWLSRWPALLQWFEVRAAILAARFTEIVAAIDGASSRPGEYGCDVFAPSVALVAGHDYARWAGAATYLTGGFTEPIGWGSVGRVVAGSPGGILADLVPGLRRGSADRVIATLIGASGPLGRGGDETRLHTEIARVALARCTTPVYPPITGLGTPAWLERTCEAIVDANLEGAMIAGFEAASTAHLRVLRRSLAGRLPRISRAPGMPSAIS